MQKTAHGAGRMEILNNQVLASATALLNFA